MGLDMYAYSVPAEDVIDDFSFQKDSVNEFFYWRKHNALHGWMEDLYKAKGGSKESFNCVPVRLSVENLLELKECIQNCSLTPRAGFSGAHRASTINTPQIGTCSLSTKH